MGILAVSSAALHQQAGEPGGGPTGMGIVSGVEWGWEGLGSLDRRETGDKSAHGSYTFA